MATEKPLRSGWADGDDSDDQKTAVSSSPSPMSLASLVAPPTTHRTSWFSPPGPGSPKQRPVTASDFRSRRASILSTSRVAEKLRDTAKGKDSVDSSADGTNSTGYDVDFASQHTGSPIPPKESSSSRSSSGSRSVSSPIPKKRGSLLVTATDVLSFRFSRRRKSVLQTQLPIVLPDVIEISASRRDDEVEERERLRDAAAQSIGLNPILMSAEDTVMEVDETETNINEYQDELDSAQTLDNFAMVDRYSADIPDTTQQPYSGPIRPLRYLSTPTAVPGFPATVAILTEFTQSSVHLIKFYPSTSLRFFSLSKNWKNRFLVLTSSPRRSSQGASPSFLHLFRTSSAEEKELERLEINEDSVVFVSDEDVAGRKNVVKVGGADVGASKDAAHADGNKTMWFLQISDPPEAQKWIALIKGIIYGQRSMRAGLGIPANTQGGVEPRGDMDVMLSMRAQGVVTSLSLKQTNFNSSRSLPANVPHPFASPDHNCSASISSQSSRSQAPSPKPQTLAVSALKGLFSTRPRSPSQSVSIDEGSERETKEDSFGKMGHNLLSMTRANGTPDIPPSPLQVLKKPYRASMSPDYRTISPSPEQRLDRRIVVEQQGASWPIRELSMKPTRALSVGSLSLQPAPRRRPWTIGSQKSMSTQPIAHVEVNKNDSIPKDEPSSAGLPSSSSFSGFSFGTPEQRTRAPSLRSVSTFASGDNGSNMDRSSSSTKTKRWSRQGSLPKRLTPPSGPPPAVPQPLTPRAQSNNPYLSEGAASCQSSSSIPSAASQVSVVSGLPTFSKRESNSSAQSANSGNATSPHNITHSITRVNGAHRMTVPPPRPAPTFAPPPAPADYDLSPRSTDTTFSPRSPSFRDSFPRRSFRLSLTAPKPPPLTTLPPRPDEPEYHARVSSSNSSTRPVDLYPIPGSPIPLISPLPPPTYPLPPTPSSSMTSATSRNSSLKQRLRILSAPSSSTIPSVPEGELGPSVSPRYPLARLYQPPGQMYTPPTTPIGERITLFQDDPSFLQMQTPSTPIISEPRAVRRLPLLPDQNVTFPEITSLSPPPRRGSRQFPVVEKEDSPKSNTLEVPSITSSDDKPISLSRHGSVISLGIMSM